MPTRKRNEYLDAIDSEDEGTSLTDTEAADSRVAGLSSHFSKRRKLTNLESEDESDDNNSDVSSSYIPRPTAPDTTKSTPQLDTPAPETTPTNTQPKLSPKRTLLSKSKPKTSKPGVIYLSRIPPFMRPSTVRTYLSLHGTIGKLFLTPEPPTHYMSRRRHGGNKKHSYIDGWVEFTRKKDAKRCVDAINGRIVGGKKGGWYRDDVWNAKYLKGFTWGDLMGGVRAEEREREEKVRVGVSREGRERREFLRQVEMGKVEETRRKKRKGREKAKEGEDEGDMLVTPTDGNDEDEKGRGFERRFRQNEVKGKASRQTEQAEEVKRVLSKIF